MALPPDRRARLRGPALVLLAWAAVALLVIAQTALTLRIRGEVRPLWMVLTPGIAGALMWAMITPALVAVTRRLRTVRERVARRTPVRAWAGYVAAQLAIAGTILLLDPIAWNWIRGVLGLDPMTLSQVIASTLVFNTASYVAVVTLVEAIDWARLSRVREAEAMALRQQLETARLRALEDQLRPHFLFNTLNLIAELVHDEPDTADVMLTRLGGLLRRAYDEMDGHLVPLEVELQWVAAYAELLTCRFRDRVDFRIDVPDRLRRHPVPAYLLQPLVENAFRHGVEHREGHTTVLVRGRERDGTLVLEVRDAGDGPPHPAREAPGERRGRGFGVRGTRERLATLYGERAGLAVAQGTHETIATAWLPLGHHG